MPAGSTRLEFTQEQAMLLEVAREFCRDRSPVSVVREQLESGPGYDPGLWREMVELGWCGIAIPEPHGGSGLGPGGVVPVLESMGRALLGTPLLSTTLAAQLVLRVGNESLCERLLPRLAGGAIATVALLDNEDWGGEHTGCQLQENGLLSGSKYFVPDAAAADWYLVVIRSGSVPALALVAREQLPDAALEPHTLIDLTRRAARIDFTGVAVGEEDIVRGDGVATALRDLQLLGALLVAAEAAGSAAACLDTLVEYLQTRRQFGRPIGSFQALKHPAVDILCAVDSSRSLVYHAATVVGDGALDRDAEIACRMAKARSVEALCYAGDRAVQFHGAMGFTWECDAQLYLRRAQWSQQQFGDARHHRKRLAALLLG